MGPHGELIIDNEGIAVNNATTPLRSIGHGLIYSITPSSLSVSTNRWSSGSLVGLRVKPNVNREELFTVTGNNPTTLFYRSGRRGPRLVGAGRQYLLRGLSFRPDGGCRKGESELQRYVRNHRRAAGR